MTPASLSPSNPKSTSMTTRPLISRRTAGLAGFLGSPPVQRCNASALCWLSSASSEPLEPLNPIFVLYGHPKRYQPRSRTFSAERSICSTSVFVRGVGDSVKLSLFRGGAVDDAALVLL